MQQWSVSSWPNAAMQTGVSVVRVMKEKLRLGINAFFFSPILERKRGLELRSYFFLTRYGVLAVSPLYEIKRRQGHCINSINRQG